MNDNNGEEVCLLYGKRIEEYTKEELIREFKKLSKAYERSITERLRVSKVLLGVIADEVDS